MHSIFKKGKSILQNGLEPIEVGRRNYKLNDPEIEALARQRMESCIGCADYIDEPIDFLRVKDERIPELSNKMCNDCGCALPYLLRQNIKICKHWK